MLELLLLIKFIIYTGVIRVEHNRLGVILTSFFISVVILQLIKRIKGKRRFAYIFGFYGFVSLLMLINGAYFTQFNSLTSVNVIGQIPQLVNVGDNLKFLIDFKKIALLMELPIVYYYFKHVKRNYDPVKKIPFKYKPNALITGIVALAILIQYFGYTGQMTSVAAQELFLYHTIDIGRSIVREHKAAAQVLTMDYRMERIRMRRNLINGNYTGVGEGKNLIVIQVEALQDFLIGRTYLGQEITPNLNRLANSESSLYYNNYFQLVGKGNTSDAEFVSHNSLYPSLGEPTYLEYEENNYYGLPWLLRDNDYTAWAFHGYERDFWNREEAYVNQGFQRFIAEDNFQFEEEVGFGMKDEDFFEQSLEYLKELDQVDDNPYYAFMVTLTSHTPFEMHEEDQHLQLKPEHKGTILGDYLHAIHYTDKELGKFIDNLEEQGLLENSVLAIYGDHFGMNAVNEIDQELMTDYLHTTYDFDHMMNVPLIINIPGETLGIEISTIGSQIDFYPTMANIMGYPIDKGIIFGRDLNNLQTRNYVYPVSFMKPGSVITEEAVFEMSRDDIYEHSRAYDRITRESIDINKFKNLSNRAIQEITLSNYILDNDLVRVINKSKSTIYK
ncbi:LTA synthase family protein [Gudongella sp. DL1XJH-153]|uniref:LTA synthase family protein n=1 Tax=Gudongella sp. DL1XJH-153 TaxID=3409804 RepID=UPI003BB62D65